MTICAATDATPDTALPGEQLRDDVRVDGHPAHGYPVQVALPLPPSGLPVTWLAVLAGRCRVP